MLQLKPTIRSRRRRDQALKDFGVLAARALALAWVPAVPEALLATALVRYLTSYIDGVKRWRAPIRVPADLGAEGYRDATTSKRGDGTFFVGIDTVPSRRAEIWLSPSDLLGGRLVVSKPDLRRSEWRTTLTNALLSGASFFLLDRNGGTAEEVVLLDACHAFGRDLDFMGLIPTSRLNIILAHEPGDPNAVPLLTAAVAGEHPTADLSLVAALLPPLAWLQHRKGLPLDTETIYASLSLPALENLAFFGQHGGGNSPVIDLPATDQAAAAELNSLTGALRALLQDLEGYQDHHPTAPHDLSTSSAESPSGGRLGVVAAFDALAAPLRATLRDIRGRDNAEPRQIIDLPAFAASLTDTGVVYVGAAQAAAPVVRLLAMAAVDALMACPPRTLNPNGRLLDRQPSFAILDDFEDYVLPQLDRAALAERGVALTIGLASFEDLKRASGNLAQSIWATTDIHVVDKASLGEPDLAAAIRADVSLTATPEEIDKIPDLLKAAKAQFFMAFHDRRVVRNQGTSKTVLHLIGYVPAFAPDPTPQPEPAAEPSPVGRWIKMAGSRVLTPR